MRVVCFCILDHESRVLTFEIQHEISSTYHTKTNGLGENWMNQTMTKALIKYIDNEEMKYLDAFLISY